MLENLAFEKKLGNCKVRTLLETLDKKDGELLKGYIADEVNWSAYTLAVALSKRGVSLDDIDFTTMESKVLPGIFFAGEVLDIDGVTGGFSFQAAWTTGWIAGKNV